jgi:hypothetical protein
MLILIFAHNSPSISIVLCTIKNMNLTVKDANSSHAIAAAISDNTRDQGSKNRNKNLYPLRPSISASNTEFSWATADPRGNKRKIPRARNIIEKGTEKK